MQIFLLAFGLILLSAAGLAVGLFFGRAPIKGSCGGLAGEECACTQDCCKEARS